jgi:hypothetical protein
VHIYSIRDVCVKVMYRPRNGGATNRRRESFDVWRSVLAAVAAGAGGAGRSVGRCFFFLFRVILIPYRKHVRAFGLAISAGQQFIHWLIIYVDVNRH